VYRRLSGPLASQTTTLAASFRSDDSSPHLQAFLTCLSPVGKDLPQDPVEL
jgi:hypothetical protein